MKVFLSLNREKGSKKVGICTLWIIRHRQRADQEKWKLKELHGLTLWNVWKFDREENMRKKIVVAQFTILQWIKWNFLRELTVFAAQSDSISNVFGRFGTFHYLRKTRKEANSDRRERKSWKLKSIQRIPGWDSHTCSFFCLYHDLPFFSLHSPHFNNREA